MKTKLTLLLLALAAGLFLSACDSKKNSDSGGSQHNHSEHSH